MNLFELVGNVTLRSAEALAGLSRVENAATRTGAVLTKMGETAVAAGRAMTTFVTLPIAAALGYSIKSASDLNETISKTEVVFKSSSKEVLDWSNGTLKNIGLAKLSALDMAATFGDMGTSMGLSTVESTKMSKGLVNLTGDMASFKNIKPAEVHTALTSVFTGETESLKRLGIVMTETNLIQFAKTQGITKSYKEMTQAEKVQLRYSYVTAMSKNSIGDFQRTQASAANQMRIFTEGLKEASTKIGAVLLPTFVKFVNLANKLLDAFMKLSPKQQEFIVKLSLIVAAIGPIILVIGKFTMAIGSIVTIFGALGLTASLVIVGIAALGAAIAAIVIKTYGLRNILNALSGVFNVVKARVSEFFTLLRAGGNPIQLIIFEIAKLIGIKTQLGQAIIKVRDGFNVMEAGIKTAVTQIWKTASKIFNDLRTVLEPFFQQIRDKVIPQVVGMVGELTQLFGAIGNAIAQTVRFIEPIWSGFWSWMKPIVTAALNIVVSVVTFTFNTIKNIFKLARQVLTGDWSGAWNTIKSILSSAVGTIKSIFSNLFSAISSVVKRIVNTVISDFRNLGSQAVNIISNLGSSLYTAGANAINMLYKGLKSKIKAIKNIAKEAADAVASFLGFKSPTKEGEGRYADKWMPNLMNMLIDGINKNKGKLAMAAEDVSRMLNFEGTSDFNYKTTIGKSMSASPKNVILQINNPKVFDTKDIDKFMNPVVARLRRLGVGSV
jgi:phage-related protein